MVVAELVVAELMVSDVALLELAAVSPSLLPLGQEGEKMEEGGCPSRNKAGRSSG